MSNNKKVLNIHQISEIDKSKFLLVDDLYSYDGNTLFTACVDITYMSISKNDMTFAIFLPKFNGFLNELCEYIGTNWSVKYVRFCNLTNKLDDKFIIINFEIKKMHEDDFCIDVKNYKVIVDKTNKCNVSDNYNIVNIEIITYLHQGIGLTKQDFQLDNNYICRSACEYNYFDVVEYLHKKIGLTKEDFQSNGNYACQMACENGHLCIVKYLHQEIGLTKQDFQSDDNYACHQVCCNGHIDVVKYLHQEIELTKEDFQSNNNCACGLACQENHIDIVKYLHQEIKLTKEDFQSNNNYACRWACECGNIDIVKYLHQEIGLTKEDFKSGNELACKRYYSNGRIDVVKYLHQEIGINDDITINYLSNLHFDIKNVNKTLKTYMLTTSDLINKYSELKHLNKDIILYNHIVKNIEYIDIHLNLPSNKFTFWSNNVNSLCTFFLKEKHLNEIKKYIKLPNSLEFNNIEFTYLDNDEYKHYDKSKCLEFCSKLVNNEKISMDVRIYSNKTYKMTKLF